MASNSFVERNDGRFMVISYPDDHSEGTINYYNWEQAVVAYLDEVSRLKMVHRVEVYEYMAGRYRLVSINRF